MSAKVVLVGHCGPDSSYLRMTVTRAIPGAIVSLADSDEELADALSGGPDLLLFNRQLEYGFSQGEGVDVIRHMSKSHPLVKTMLVSNYPEAQAAAVAAGALPGFGKKELGSPRVAELLGDAIGKARPAPHSSGGRGGR